MSLVIARNDGDDQMSIQLASQFKAPQYASLTDSSTTTRTQYVAVVIL